VTAVVMYARVALYRTLTTATSSHLSHPFSTSAAFHEEAGKPGARVGLKFPPYSPGECVPHRSQPGSVRPTIIPPYQPDPSPPTPPDAPPAPSDPIPPSPEIPPPPSDPVPPAPDIPPSPADPFPPPPQAPSDATPPAPSDGEWPPEEARIRGDN
jgi:hypothetical protein